jgi:hypothetical protein
MVDDIINRVKIFLGCKSDAALARKIGMSPQNFLSQKKTGSAEKEAYRVAVSEGANPDWLRTGKGEMKAAPDPGADYWKNKYITCMEELNEARKKIDSLTASPMDAAGRNTAAGQ